MFRYFAVYWVHYTSKLYKRMYVDSITVLRDVTLCSLVKNLATFWNSLLLRL